MNGFYFNGKHSDDFNIVAKSSNRTVLPSKKLDSYEIPGRDGTLDGKNITYNTRDIKVLIAFNGPALTAQALRAQIREIAKWLSAKGQLIFDDEPDKAYQAQVIKGIDLNQMMVWGESDVTFTCQPFAESTNYITNIKDITKKKQETTVSVSGTQDTPCIIIIKNTGKTNVTGIEITRKAGE